MSSFEAMPTLTLSLRAVERVSRRFLVSATSRMEVAGSVMELSWPSGFVGSKKTSVGNFILRLEAPPSEAKAECAPPRRDKDVLTGRGSSSSAFERGSAPTQHLKKDMFRVRGEGDVENDYFTVDGNDIRSSGVCVYRVI